MSATTERATTRCAAELVEDWRKHGIDPSNFAAMLFWDVPRSRCLDFVIGVELNRFLDAALAHPRTATLGCDLALTPRGWIVLDFNPIWGPTGGEACTREGIPPILARLYPDAWR